MLANTYVLRIAATHGLRQVVLGLAKPMEVIWERPFNCLLLRFMN